MCHAQRIHVSHTLTERILINAANVCVGGRRGGRRGVRLRGGNGEASADVTEPNAKLVFTIKAGVKGSVYGGLTATCSVKAASGHMERY